MQFIMYCWRVVCLFSKSCDNMVMKNEKELNKELLDMRKKGKIPVRVYEALRSTGAQPAKSYGLAKVHKKTPLRPVLSIPGSCYHKFNKFLTPFFQKIERANIETNTNDAPKTLEQMKQILSLGVKSLYTNVPVKEAINIALRSLYARDDKPDIPRTTMKCLRELAVTNVHLKCNESWYCNERRVGNGCVLGGDFGKPLDEIVGATTEITFTYQHTIEHLSQLRTPCDRTFQGSWVWSS